LGRLSRSPFLLTTHYPLSLRQFLDRLAEDAMPALIERLSTTWVRKLNTLPWT
jgi:hypothetical protein